MNSDDETPTPSIGIELTMECQGYFQALLAMVGF